MEAWQLIFIFFHCAALATYFQSIFFFFLLVLIILSCNFGLMSFVFLIPPLWVDAFSVLVLCSFSSPLQILFLSHMAFKILGFFGRKNLSLY